MEPSYQFNAQGFGRALAAALVLNDDLESALEGRVLATRETIRDVGLQLTAQGLVRLAVQIGPESLEQLVAVEVIHDVPLVGDPVFAPPLSSVPLPLTYPARLA